MRSCDAESSIANTAWRHSRTVLSTTRREAELNAMRACDGDSLAFNTLHRNAYIDVQTKERLRMKEEDSRSKTMRWRQHRYTSVVCVVCVVWCAVS
jgi:hypothetical protein